MADGYARISERSDQESMLSPITKSFRMAENAVGIADVTGEPSNSPLPSHGLVLRAIQ